MKPGYKTTEFWITLGTIILTSLSIFGIIQPGEVSIYSDAITKGVLSAATLINTALYIYTRFKSKGNG